MAQSTVRIVEVDKLGGMVIHADKYIVMETETRQETKHATSCSNIEVRLAQLTATTKGQEEQSTGMVQGSKDTMESCPA